MDGEMLTMEEIKERFAPDWVLIVDHELDEYQRLLSGRVVFHSPVRDEVYDKATEIESSRCAFRFLGEAPKDMVFIF